MVLPSPDMESCTRKLRCKNGPNKGKAYDAANPCGDLTYKVFDADTCDCVPDGTMGYLLYDQFSYSYDLTEDGCYCDYKGDQQCVPEGCCYPYWNNPNVAPEILNIRIPYQGFVPFPITIVHECNRTQVPSSDNTECGCTSSYFEGTSRDVFYDGDGIEIGYAARRDEGFQGTWCSSGNTPPCGGTSNITNIRYFTV